MRTANLNATQPLLLSLVLMVATPLAPTKAVEDPPADRVASTAANGNPKLAMSGIQIAAAAIAEPKPLKDEIKDLQKRLDDIDTRSKSDGGLFGIAWPIWLSGGSGLIGLMALVLAMSTMARVKKQREEFLRRLDGNKQSLLKRIGGVEVQMEQERLLKQSLAMAAVTPKPASPEPQPATATAWQAPLADPYPQYVPTPVPAPVSKASLINTLNAGDRLTLREAATAELNITSESENALAMGRAVATELEEVPGGGSYWLVSLQGQDWLFPTDRTLKGFAAAQPAKGLFYYEQQTIAQPQLIEPALLESSGTRWSVKTMGRIATS